MKKAGAWLGDLRAKFIEREAVHTKKFLDSKRRPTHPRAKVLRKKELVKPAPSVALGDEDTRRGRRLEIKHGRRREEVRRRWRPGRSL